MDKFYRALLRPGRFDVEVHVPVPDLRGRKEILELYLGKIKLNPDVNVEVLARGTTGFTGADIENVSKFLGKVNYKGVHTGADIENVSKSLGKVR